MRLIVKPEGACGNAAVSGGEAKVRYRHFQLRYRDRQHIIKAGLNHPLNFWSIQRGERHPVPRHG